MGGLHQRIITYEQAVSVRVDEAGIVQALRTLDVTAAEVVHKSRYSISLFAVYRKHCKFSLIGLNVTEMLLTPHPPSPLFHSSHRYGTKLILNMHRGCLTRFS